MEVLGTGLLAGVVAAGVGEVLSPVGGADAAGAAQPAASCPAKNVIFINGDGMSAAQRTAEHGPA